MTVFGMNKEMTDQEIWEEACERVYVAKYGPIQINMPWPPIGDPECAVAMLEWPVRQGYVLKIREEPKYYEKVARFVVVINSDPEHIHRHVRLALALASAVIAIPVEKA